MTVIGQDQDQTAELADIRQSGTQQPFAAVGEAARANAESRTPRLSKEEQADALSWFLSAEDHTDLTHTFQINVGTPINKKWIDWTVQPVDVDHSVASVSGRRSSRPVGHRPLRLKTSTKKRPRTSRSSSKAPSFRTSARQPRSSG